MSACNSVPRMLASCSMPSVVTREILIILSVKSTGRSEIYAVRGSPLAGLMSSSRRVIVLLLSVAVTFCSGRFISALVAKSGSSVERVMEANCLSSSICHSMRMMLHRCCRMMSAELSPVVYFPIMKSKAERCERSLLLHCFCPVKMRGNAVILLPSET